MMARIFSPLVCGIIGLLISTAIGASLIWRELSLMVEETIRVRAAQQPNELRKKGWDFWTVEIENLSAELKDDLAQVKQQQTALAQRQDQITREEQELATKRADLDAMEKQISDRVVEISADELVNLKKLAQTYSNLTPTAAVAIIRELDDNTAVKILSLMKPDVVAPIFDQMSKTATSDASLARRAALLSDKLRLVKTARPTSP